MNWGSLKSSSEPLKGHEMQLGWVTGRGPGPWHHTTATETYAECKLRQERMGWLCLSNYDVGSAGRPRPQLQTQRGLPTASAADTAKAGE